jgi:hypothetical protein
MGLSSQLRHDLTEWSNDGALKMVESRPAMVISLVVDVSVVLGAKEAKNNPAVRSNLAAHRTIVSKHQQHQQLDQVRNSIIICVYLHCH